MPGKVYERDLTEEQRGFGKGKGCVDQIFAIRIMVDEYLGKDEKLYAALMAQDS